LYCGILVWTIINTYRYSFTIINTYRLPTIINTTTIIVQYYMPSEGIIFIPPGCILSQWIVGASNFLSATKQKGRQKRKIDCEGTTHSWISNPPCPYQKCCDILWWDFHIFLSHCWCVNYWILYAPIPTYRRRTIIPTYHQGETIINYCHQLLQSFIVAIIVWNALICWVNWLDGCVIAVVWHLIVECICVQVMSGILNVTFL
jgi:hypothetical protein